MKTSLIAAAFVALIGSATFAHVLTQDKPMSKSSTSAMSSSKTTMTKKSAPKTTTTRTTRTKKTTVE